MCVLLFVINRSEMWWILNKICPCETSIFLGHVSRHYLQPPFTLRLLMSYIYMERLFLMFLDHTRRRTTVGRIPLDEWSARHRDLYLTTHDTHNRQIFMPPVGFEPTISADERPQTYAVDSAATGTGTVLNCQYFRIFDLGAQLFNCWVSNTGPNRSLFV